MQPASTPTASPRAPASTSTRSATGCTSARATTSRSRPALRGLVTHLVYPLPARAGLGIHVTLDLAGGLRAGPDTTYVDTLDYRVDPDKAALFGAAVRRYLPRVRDEDLQPDYAGIRPKLQAPNGPTRDFVIEEASAHGVPGLVNLIGIESPGLTASEAIAEHVEAIVAR